MEKVQKAPEILPASQERVLSLDPSAILASIGFEYHTCFETSENPNILKSILLKMLCRCGNLALTPTSHSSPQLIRFWDSRNSSAFNINYYAARLIREIAGDASPVGGIVDLSFLEVECRLKEPNLRDHISSIREQVSALIEGGAYYIILQGIKNTKHLKSIFQSGIINRIPLVFTVSLDDSSQLPSLVELASQRTDVEAAGVEIDVRVDEEGTYHLDIGKLKSLSSQLDEIGIPMIVRLNFEYRFDGKRLTTKLETHQIRQIIDTLYQCGVRIIGIGRGATLSLAEKLLQPETSILEPANALIAMPITDRIPVQ